MISLSTKSAIIDILKRWSGGQKYYYIKRPSIIEKVEHNGRTFYAKFERINKILDEDIIASHLNRDTTLAVPITRNGFGENLFFIYEGESPERFIYLLEHLLISKMIEGYRVFFGKRPDIRIVDIPMPKQEIRSLYAFAKELSDILEKNMTKNWKILPNPALPESYNIVTVPYIN